MLQNSALVSLSAIKMLTKNKWIIMQLAKVFVELCPVSYLDSYIHKTLFRNNRLFSIWVEMQTNLCNLLIASAGLWCYEVNVNQIFQPHVINKTKRNRSIYAPRILFSKIFLQNNVNEIELSCVISRINNFILRKMEGN